MLLLFDSEIAQNLLAAHYQSITSQADKQPARKILYIEDRPDNAALIRRAMEVVSLNYEIVIAQTGQSGLTLAHQEQPDLVLLDMNLPDIDGYSLPLLLRQVISKTPLPIIALTADTSPGTQERCLVAGCDYYLTKPVTAPDLWQKLENFLKATNWSQNGSA